MSTKATTSLILALLICSTLSYAARTNPSFPEATTSIKTQHKGVEARRHDDVVVGDKCEEGIEEEECLMRRTLVAHLDYIYTQSKNP